MSKKTKTRQQEVDDNYEYFKTLLPEILMTEKDKFALLHNCQVRGYFDTLRDAFEASQVLGEENYSIQKVSDEIVDLGNYSHVDSLV